MGENLLPMKGIDKKGKLYMFLHVDLHIQAIFLVGNIRTLKASNKTPC